MNNPRPVLYAEDDENDVFLLQRAFKKLNIPNPLQTVADGRLAIAYLSGAPPYEKREEYPLPVLLLLDLSMPGKHGLYVLKWMKAEASVAALPVVIFTSSNQGTDIDRAQALGAEGYIIKPGDPGELLEIVRNLQTYWLGDTRPQGTFAEFMSTRSPVKRGFC